MIYIRHRANSIADLKTINPAWGCEIDLRSGSGPNSLVVTHDPWTSGDNFEDWLDLFAKQSHQGPLLLNTKEDGLEAQILDLLRKYNINSYFFLDTTLPTLVRWSVREQNKNFSVRFSAFEPIEFVLKFKAYCDWVWVDCFDGKYPAEEQLLKLAQNFKLCLVSPELQGQKLTDFVKCEEARNLKGIVHAICTKQPQLWES